MSACRSEPRSIGMSGPNGYGPGSLSSAYWNVTGVVVWALFTILNGKPYGGRPKSGCRFELPAFIEASHAELCPFTGRLEMSVFQMSSAGNTVHVVPGRWAPGREAARSEAGPSGRRDAIAPPGVAKDSASTAAARIEHARARIAR